MPGAENAQVVTTVAVSAGKVHSLLLVEQTGVAGEDESGSTRVYTWGSNEYGQLGHGKAGKQANHTSPECVLSLSGVRVTQIATGDAHSIVLSDAGVVYTFGFGGHGRLGHGNYGNRATPTEVVSLRELPVQQVSAGGFHTAILTRDGVPYTCGSNRYGQLGQGDADGIQATLTPVKALSGTVIEQVATGGLHTFLLEKGGMAVYSCGSNRYGQLGHQDSSSHVVPSQLQEANMGQLVGKQIKQLATGTAHSALLTTTGKVYTFGWGANGRLGHGDTPFRRHVPSLLVEVPGMAEVVEVSAGDSHTSVLTSEGAVFTFGSDEKKQLGHKAMHDRKQPEIVAGLDSTRCLGVASGSLHTLVVAEPSPMAPGIPLVYSWGNNALGQLGHADTWDHTTPKLIQTLPDWSQPLAPCSPPPQAMEQPSMSPEISSPMSPNRRAATHEGIANGDWRLLEAAAARATGPELRRMLQASLSETAKQLRERTAAESEELAGSGSPGEASIADTVEMVKMEQALENAICENQSLKEDLEKSNARVTELTKAKDSAETDAAQLEVRIVQLMDHAWGAMCDMELDASAAPVVPWVNKPDSWTSHAAAVVARTADAKAASKVTA